MLSLSQIANQTKSKKSIDKILKTINKFDLDNPDVETKAHLKCNIARDTIFTKKLKNDLIILQVPISFDDIMPKDNYGNIDNNKITDILCGRYNENYEFNYEYLSENIQHCIAENKIVFITFIIKEYCVYDYKDGIDYSTHSTCMILVPNKKNACYSAYYINSHGKEMKDTNIFRRVRSKTRTFNIKLNEPAEIIFIRKLISSFNSLKDINNKQISLQWENSKKYTYKSINLQTGDYHGICFAFPQVILHYFGKFYNKTRSYGNTKIQKIKTLLKNGKLELFVKSCFIDFDNLYKMRYLDIINENEDSTDKYNNLMEDTLLYKNTMFVKSLTHSLVEYFKQITIE